MEELQRADIEQRDRLMQAFREGYRIMTEAQQKCAHMLRHTTDEVVGSILERAREDARNMLVDTEVRCRTMKESNEECERRAHNFWLGREGSRARVRPTAVADNLDDDDDGDDNCSEPSGYQSGDNKAEQPVETQSDDDSTTMGSSDAEVAEAAGGEAGTDPQAVIVVRPSALVDDTPADDTSPRHLLITGKKRRSADQTQEKQQETEEARCARNRTTSFQFKRNLALVRRYRATHGQAPPGTGIEKQEFEGLAEFVRTARREQAQRLLEAEQVERAEDEDVDPAEFVTDDVVALDQSGFSWSDVKLTSQQGYELLSDFAKLYGCVNVPRSYTSARFPGLGMWLEEQVADMENVAAGAKRGDRHQTKKLLCLGVSPSSLVLDEEKND